MSVNSIAVDSKCQITPVFSELLAIFSDPSTFFNAEIRMNE